jgi:hypothetical protein
MGTYDPSKGALRARMAREMDPYAIPVMSIGRHNCLPAGYANKSLRTCLTARPRRGISDVETSDTRLAAGAVGPVEPDPELLSARAPALTPPAARPLESSMLCRVVARLGWLFHLPTVLAPAEELAHRCEARREWAA